MSIGTGIFLAALLFAPIYLYRITRDRWNWRKLVLRTLFGIILIAVLGSGSIFLYGKIQGIPRKQTSYEGLKLGMTMTEVIYTLGKPNVVYPNSNVDEGLNVSEAKATNSEKTSYTTDEIFGTEIKKLKDDDKIENYREWGFQPLHDSSQGEITSNSGKTYTTLIFDENHILRQINCFSGENAVYNWEKCPQTLGIQEGDSEDSLIEKLGNPSNQYISEYGQKFVAYKKFNVFFRLYKQRVQSIGIRDFDYHG